MLAQWSMIALLASFALAAAIIFFSGLRLTILADRLADRTGLGEAIAGGVLLGAATSFSGTIVSITAAFDGHASLAFSNSIGGIAVQTAFLAIADVTYRKANLEHAAAELANIFQALVLIGLLALPLSAMVLPEFTIFAVHPVSFLIPLVYAGSLVASRIVRETPMWHPVSTSETRDDFPEEESDAARKQSTQRLFAMFFVFMGIMGCAGWAIAKIAAEMTIRFDLSASLVGALMTAVTTSLPELVTTLAAVRRGALQLAVGGIIGGNTFDVLFLTFSDVAYREGSLHHAIERSDLFWLAVALVSTAVLLLGLIVRERRGLGGIGFESAAVLAIWLGAAAVQVWLG